MIFFFYIKSNRHDDYNKNIYLIIIFNVFDEIIDSFL